MKIYLMTFLLGLCGCSTLITSHESPEVPRLKRESEEAELINAEKFLALARFEEARVLFRDFQWRHPQSVFFQSARIGEAQALEGMGRFQEAATLDRDIYLKTLKDQPEIAAQSLYHMSFVYEALGDDMKTVAALLDAKKLADHLSIETALAEIPARLAAVYARQGRESEAVSYLSEADKGIVKVMASKGPRLQKEWLAKTYFQMGSVSTNQLSADNFDDFIRGQKWVQVYLIKSLRQDDPTWSLRAQNKLQEIYRDLYIQFESVREQRELQIRLGGDLIDLMDQAELYRPFAGQVANTYEQAFFQYLTEVRKKTEKILYGSGETMSLTEESQKLNSLKRSGRVKADSLLPEEQKSSISLPPKVVPTEDPNL